jgi:hypothetical protein
VRFSVFILDERVLNGKGAIAEKKKEKKRKGEIRDK